MRVSSNPRDRTHVIYKENGVERFGHVHQGVTAYLSMSIDCVVRGSARTTSEMRRSVLPEQLGGENLGADGAAGGETVLVAEPEMNPA